MFLIIHLSVNVTISESLSKSLISRTFLKPYRFWFQRIGQEKYRLPSAKNGSKNTQNVKTIINNLNMKPDFPIIKKIVKKL